MSFTIGIVGLGLIGGSLGLDFSLWLKKRRIIGYDRERRIALLAKEKGAVDDLAQSVEEVAREADLLFIATPIREIPKVFSLACPFLRRGTKVFDVGSSKEWVFEEIRPEELGFEYLGFHPMGGAREGGIERAQPGLFRGMPVLVVPKDLPQETKKLVQELGIAIGGKVFF